MCYGSGCSRENHMGDCISFLTKEQKALIEKSKYSECLLFGDDHSVIDFYLSKEEHQQVFEIDCSKEIMDKMYNLAYERWREDKERLELIEKLENE